MTKKPTGALVPTGKNLPAKKGSANALLASIRSAKAVVRQPATPLADPNRSARLAQALAGSGEDPKLVFAFDATASREEAWETSREVTDALFRAIPGKLQVALAVHGGSNLHTFTAFTTKPNQLRDLAASIHCIAGFTRLVDIMDRTRKQDGVKVLLYIGDVFEEHDEAAYELADSLKIKGTRVIILHEGHQSANVFAGIAKRTGGAVLPFDPASVDLVREMLEAVGALAVGGVKLLQQTKSAGATLLLEHLTNKKD